MRTLVCMGDSITAGQHLTGGERWTTILARHLENWQVINRGHAGDTSRDGLARFPRFVQLANPDIVLIQYGANDCNRWETDRGLPRVSPQSFRANLTEMIDRVRAFGAAPILLNIALTRLGHDYGVAAAAYNEIVRKVVRDTGAQLGDVYTPLAAEDVLLDGIHLNTRGHELYADAVANLLRQPAEVAA